MTIQSFTTTFSVDQTPKTGFLTPSTNVRGWWSGKYRGRHCKVSATNSPTGTRTSTIPGSGWFEVVPDKKVVLAGAGFLFVLPGGQDRVERHQGGFSRSRAQGQQDRGPLHS